MTFRIYQSKSNTISCFSTDMITLVSNDAETVVVSVQRVQLQTFPINLAGKSRVSAGVLT